MDERKTKSYKDIANQYAKDVVSGAIIAGKEVVAACQRYLDDLKRDDLELRTHDPDIAINIMQGTLVHAQGEDMEGRPLLGQPFILQPWQIFVVYNLLGFWYAGTNERRFKEAFIMLARKNGKALGLDQTIPTPDGWKQMRDIHLGDFVFGTDGQPVLVTAESEIFNKPMYLVAFEDGSTVKASADHIWTVQTKYSRRTARREKTCTDGRARSRRYDLEERDGWFEITTEEMVGNFKRIRPDGKGTEYLYRVPMNGAVQYPEADLPIDPYTFGVWLGDGCSTNSRITCSDEDRDEMTANLETEGHTCKWHNYDGRAGAIGIDVADRGKPSPFRDALRELGVFKNKHIPRAYLQASEAQRWALLQGLMDTDGFCEKRGQCEFTQKSKTIADGMVELLRSLGLKAAIHEKRATCNGKDCGIAYRVMFYTTKDKTCFRLRRKTARLKDYLAPRMLNKSITGIEPIPQEPSKCIAVDSADHLYLAGDGFTATHNTSFVSALAWAVGIMQRKSGSKIYLVANALKQTLEAFGFLCFSLKFHRCADDFTVHDNNQDHSISHTFHDEYGRPDGTMNIIALASNPDAQDSFNCNFAIADEVAAYKNPKQYSLFKDAQKAYRNKLMIGITTAGDNINSFGHGQMEYAVKVATGVVEDDSFFAFVARADQDAKGNVDYTDPIQHQKANPSYGVTVSPEELMNDSLQAQNDPQKRKNFLARSLNIYTSSLRSYFDLDEFKRSDRKYNFTLEELAALPISWYGGADLSRWHDLTAASLFGHYDKEDLDIIITHGFFPVEMAAKKADEDHIPLFGWQEDGWLTICNSPTVNVSDVVNWFVEMRQKGFKIQEVGHDRKFSGEEYYPQMKAAGFQIAEQPQMYWIKSKGFRRIEKSAKDGRLFYMHSGAYEYCVSNVHAIEKTDDMISYDKIAPKLRIDLFDSSVFACVRYIEAHTKAEAVRKWYGG